MRPAATADGLVRYARTRDLDEEIAIVGAGPAGIAAAVQLTRSGRDPIVFEREGPGGMVRNAWRVENYPGFPDGIPGAELAQRMVAGLERWGTRVVAEEVTDLDLTPDGEGFVLRTPSRERTTRAVIVASGTDPLPFAIPGLETVPPERFHREVYGLRDVEGASIAIIGGGDAAFDYALSLGERNLAFILNRSFHARALNLLEDAAASSESVRRLDSTRVTALRSDGSRIFVRTEGACPMEFVVDHVVAAVGREPAISFISDAVLSARVDLEAKGLFYMVGDVARGSFRQVAIAVGDGLEAAMAVHRALPGGAR
ncbi:MAG: NAD(P)/FAD-dependent oxidoreductase [Thermoplasmata archaeon]|nr:NAD(P)/FAD-dependent oxidoreductase [Thermoplasmata archaeon]